MEAAAGTTEAAQREAQSEAAEAPQVLAAVPAAALSRRRRRSRSFRRERMRCAASEALYTDAVASCSAHPAEGAPHENGAHALPNVFVTCVCLLLAGALSSAAAALAVALIAGVFSTL